MKKSFLFVMALLCAITMFISCDDSTAQSPNLDSDIGIGELDGNYEVTTEVPAETLNKVISVAESLQGIILEKVDLNSLNNIVENKEYILQSTDENIQCTVKLLATKLNKDGVPLYSTQTLNATFDNYNGLSGKYQGKAIFSEDENISIAYQFANLKYKDQIIINGTLRQLITDSPKTTYSINDDFAIVVKGKRYSIEKLQEQITQMNQANTQNN